MDPQTSTDAVSFDVLNAVLDGLFRIDADGVLQPALAADFPEISEDGTHYVFTIREGAEWSDGEPVTAHDFEYAWKRAMNPLTGSQYNYQMEHIKGAADVIYFEDVELPSADELSEEEYATAVEEYQAAIDPLLAEVGVKAVDDHTLEVDLVQPTPFFLDLTSFITYLPAPMHLEQELGDQYAINADNMAFSGPFMITEWVPDDHITLEKNPNYWDAESVKLEKINMYMIKEISTYLNMYETGELDSTGIPGSYLDQYRDDPGYGNLAEAVAWYIEPNLEDPLMGNKKFREAINAAFDRQAFVDGVLENGSFPATALTPPSITDANGDSFHDEWVGDLLPTTADTELARQLLEEVCAELGYEVPSVE